MDVIYQNIKFYTLILQNFYLYLSKDGGEMGVKKPSVKNRKAIILYISTK